jgi:putative membrane protein
MTPPENSPDPQTSDVTRRTWLAAERTWLAWWRTGIAVAAVGIAIGRGLPLATGGAQWPFRILGLGYAALAVVILVLGAVRQLRAAQALRTGSYEPLSSPVVMLMTAAAIALALLTMILVAVGF